MRFSVGHGREHLTDGWASTRVSNACRGAGACTRSRAGVLLLSSIMCPFASPFVLSCICSFASMTIGLGEFVRLLRRPSVRLFSHLFRCSFVRL
jgi:hypothetical protein